MKKVLGYDPNFNFSEDQRKALWHIIKSKFDPKKASLLTDWLEIHCRTAGYLKSKTSKNSHRKMLSAILMNFQQTKIYLDMIEKIATDEYEKAFNPVQPKMVEKSFHAGISGPKTFSINYDSKLLAEEALRPLNRLIQNMEYALKVQPARAGTTRRSPSRFIKIIAQEYEEILGEKPKNGGVFLRVVRQLLSVLDLPSQNPRRAIAEALKNLS